MIARLVRTGIAAISIEIDMVIIASLNGGSASPLGGKGGPLDFD